MAPGTLILVALIFTLAGLVKGTLGLGLPTISMGLLAIVMTPIEAAAIVLLPSFATNVWQMLAGPGLGRVLGRLWPMMLAVCVGTWLGLGLMTGAGARAGDLLLGAALVLYAIFGLVAIRFSVARRHEPWLGPLAGATTGIIAAATGVFVIPAVPYLQAVGLEKEELVQALGLSFTVSTLALAVNVTAEHGLNAANIGVSLAALAFASGGMWCGQALRQRLSPELFRRTFFAGLLLLGLYLAVAE